MLKKLVALVSLIGLVLGLAACNTMEGVGQDVQAEGRRSKRRPTRTSRSSARNLKEPPARGASRQQRFCPLSMNLSSSTPASWSRSTAPTSTPTRSSRSSS